MPREAPTTSATCLVDAGIIVLCLLQTPITDDARNIKFVSFATLGYCQQSIHKVRGLLESNQLIHRGQPRCLYSTNYPSIELRVVPKSGVPVIVSWVRGEVE
jgi:hypothetical protein